MPALTATVWDRHRPAGQGQRPPTPPRRGWRGRLAARPAAAHIALALGLSWAIWLPGLALLDVALPVIALGAFGPAVAGAVMVRAEGGSLREWARGMAVFRVPARWYAVALAVPLLEPASQAVLALARGVPLTVAELPARAPMYVMGFLLALLIGGGQEEPGWRGYLLPALLRRRSPLLAGAVVGIVWAVWHLPLFVLDVLGYGRLSFPLYVAFAVAVSIVLTWLRLRTRGTVILAMLLHAGINSAGAWLPVAADDVDASFERLAQVAATVAFGLLVAALVARHGRRLGADDTSAAYHDGSTPTT